MKWDPANRSQQKPSLPGSSRPISPSGTPGGPRQSQPLSRPVHNPNQTPSGAWTPQKGPVYGPGQGQGPSYSPQQSSPRGPQYHNPRQLAAARLNLAQNTQPVRKPEPQSAPLVQKEEPDAGANDQRRYQRMKMIMGLVCRRQGKKDTNVFTDDVSAGGIKFSCSAQLERGEEVFLDVPIGNGEYKSIPGRIAWIKPSPIGGASGGIEFNRMDASTQKEWLKFIERNAEPDTGT